MHTRIKYIPVGYQRPGFAHGLHWQRNGVRYGVDFQRIRTTNNLRNCLHARIKHIQIRERRSARPSK